MVDSSFPRQLAPNVTGQMGLTVHGKMWVKVHIEMTMTKCEWTTWVLYLTSSWVTYFFPHLFNKGCFFHTYFPRFCSIFYKPISLTHASMWFCHIWKSCPNLYFLIFRENIVLGGFSKQWFFIVLYRDSVTEGIRHLQQKKKSTCSCYNTSDDMQILFVLYFLSVFVCWF